MAVEICLEDDEALVRFEWLASAKWADGVELPERNALWALEAVLQKTLVAPFAPDYSARWESARRSLLERSVE